MGRYVFLILLFLFFGCSSVKNELGNSYLNGNIEKIKEILGKGFNKKIYLNARVKNSDTLLSLAVKNCDYEMVEYLLSIGADINVKIRNIPVSLYIPECEDCLILHQFLIHGLDPNNGLLLHAVVANGNMKCLKIFAEAPDIDWNKTTKEGINSAHIAGLFQKPRMLKYLLEKGVSFNRKNVDGDTPLHFACDPDLDLGGKVTSEQISCIEVLLEFGADPFLKNNSGESVFDLASKNGIEEINSILRRWKDQHSANH